MTEKNELAVQRRISLLSWMSKNDVSRTELSEKLGVGRAYVSLLFKEGRFFGEKSARSIEKKLGLPNGFLDADGTKPQAVEEWVSPDDLADDVYALVPRVSVSLVAGAGSVVDVEEALPPLAFRKDWLQKKSVSRRDNLRIVSVHGDSMSPYINSGDIVMIDTGQNLIQDHQIYAIEHSSEVRIKRLSKRFDGGLMIRSDGAGFPEESISPDQVPSLRILGKLLWRGG